MEMSFHNLVHEKIIPFMQGNNLTDGTFKTSVGDSAVIKRDKHGFYSVKITTREDVRLGKV
ncbi:hypothetical protein P4V86_03250 [Brevibacillus laterosporus]|uniref:hypothetical protein n=1 Tax=Brevibacillus laterosporus TaxID=1465 RepID=UPI00037B00EF|nr:hypothetical protein [Brevibacillus laterosporus]ATO48540.1 hypothetical protein BrL25_05085 [Brevibacillus laterosporus DSM 25]MED2002374.1 hypothetical protein [Brevibacillus laterosporus]